MNIHEYQAKEILRGFGVPIPPGDVATTPAEAEQIARRIGRTVVVKAQVHAGGRGKAGGVKLARTPEEARDVAGKILGMQIKGLPVQKVLVTDAADIASEAYVGIILDRASKKPVFMAVPKRRTSKRKKRARNTHKTAPAIVIQPCPRCQAMRRPHHVCSECGYYDGKQRVAAREA